MPCAQPIRSLLPISLAIADVGTREQRQVVDPGQRLPEGENRLRQAVGRGIDAQRSAIAVLVSRCF